MGVRVVVIVAVVVAVVVNIESMLTIAAAVRVVNVLEKSRVAARTRTRAAVVSMAES